MMRSRWTRAIAIALALVLLAAACGDDDDDTTAAEPTEEAVDEATAEATEEATAEATEEATAEATEEATGEGTTEAATGDGGCEATVPGTQITMGVFSEAPGLDPARATGSGTTGGTEMAALYDVLMRWNPETGVWDPHLAESLEPNEDASVWTLTLREGITYGNGDPLTAEDVKINIERHQDEENSSSSSSIVAPIIDMEVVDDQTLVITLDGPWGGFPYVLGDEPGMIANPAVLDELGPDEFLQRPVGAGAGAYEITRFAPGEEIVMTAKDDYWGGPVCVETLRFTLISGAPATYEAFQNDEINVAFLREALTIAEAREDGVDGLTELNNAGGVVLINQGVRDSTPPTRDLRLRRAVMLAMDPDVINERANEGAGLPYTGLVHPDSVLYTEGFQPAPLDPEEAAALVEEVKADGINGEEPWDGSIRLLCSNQPSRVDWAIAVEALLENVGFDVEVDVDGTTQDMVAQVARNADFDLSCWSFTVTEYAPYTRLNNHLRCEGPANRIGYCDERMEVLLDELRVATELEDIQAALLQIEDLVQETAASAVTETVEVFKAHKPEVQGILETQESILLFHDAYIADS